ncbi:MULTISPECIES: hypothetical protein [Niallia]|jgi:hypothetical protein
MAIFDRLVISALIGAVVGILWGSGALLLYLVYFLFDKMFYL